MHGKVKMTDEASLAGAENARNGLDEISVMVTNPIDDSTLVGFEWGLASADLQASRVSLGFLSFFVGTAKCWAIVNRFF